MMIMQVYDGRDQQHDVDSNGGDELMMMDAWMPIDIAYNNAAEKIYDLLYKYKFIYEQHSSR